MNCAKCEDSLSEYLENALDASDRASVESHLQSCSACAELLDGVRGVIEGGKEFEAPQPSPWLSSRILANTPQVIRITWRDWVVGAWKKISEPRFALALLTSTLVLGWMANM